MSESTNEHRLPPPAFPPGQRRHAHVNSGSASENSAEPTTDDGIINPDDPMPERRDAMAQAFISPDEPIPERKIELAENFSDLAEPDPDEEGEVVGMDLDAHTDPVEVVTGGDPHVMELVEAVGKLAEALKRKGEAGLRSHPDMGRFDQTLRAYCVGYLAGRRAEEPPLPPIVDEDY